MKYVKIFLTWLLCVFMSFATVFTLSAISENGIAGIYSNLFYEKFEKELQEHADEAIAYYEDITNAFFAQNEMALEVKDNMPEKKDLAPRGNGMVPPKAPKGENTISQLENTTAKEEDSTVQAEDMQNVVTQNAGNEASKENVIPREPKAPLPRDKSMNADEQKIAPKQDNSNPLENTTAGIFAEGYKNHPVGTIRYMLTLANIMSTGSAIINSAILGVIIGTAIFLLIGSKDKKGMLIVVSVYIVSIVLLGFLQGVQQISGNNLTFLDYWVFPTDYILQATIVFALVALARVLRLKGIAKKLNEKLQK